MKSIRITVLAAAVVFAVSNCKSIDKTTIGGKPAVTATQVSPVIFGALGATAQSCIDAIAAEGATEIEAVKGISENASILSRLSGLEACQATGVAAGAAAAPAKADAKPAAPAAAPAKADAKKPAPKKGKK